MQTVIIVIHLLIVLTMIGLVLLQKSEGGGLGMGGGGGFMSTRGTANLLSRSTAYLAGAFFVTSLLLSWMAGHNRAPTSIINTGTPAGPTVPGPGSPTVPLGSGSGGVLDQLQRPAAPAQPAGPQVPQSQ
jgi:preprotein translocase subunit SecG